MELRRYLAELVGTFALTMAVSVSIVVGTPLATAVVAALTLGLFVYTVGPISGAHLNPAVTVALATIKKINLREAFGYLVSQVVGALLAMLFVQLYAGSAVAVEAVDSGAIAIAEAIGAFMLAWGVCSVVHGKVKAEASGLVIGGSLLAGLMVAGGVSNGILNPAVAIGLGSISAIYLLAPICGAVIAAWAYSYIAGKC